MTENEFLLEDRKAKIQSVMRQYGEENFYISFSGGKDSTVLHHLVDEALPGNKIPRVYSNTGIEYNEVVKFVRGLAEEDSRIQIIEPRVPIRKMLEEEGYPFKSKFHSAKVERYQKHGLDRKSVRIYLGMEPTKNGVYLTGDNSCPKILKYQFEEGTSFKISNKCCDRLKKDLLHEWQRENKKTYGILGIMPDEGGQRASAKCLAFSDGKLKNFQPLVPLTKAWEDWYIKKRGFRLCKLYYPPYNFERTGCKGCPYNIHIQRELDTLDKFFPNERKQCERIWKPVYEEYRRIGYRLRPLEFGRQTTIDEFLPQEEKPD